MATTTEVGPHKGLLEWLADEKVEHEVHEHRLTFTARETARAEGIEPRAFAKVVVAEADDGQRALFVVDAADRLSLTKAADVMQTRHVQLVREPELQTLAADCELGAIPAVGKLFGLPLYADRGIQDDPTITFNAGSHHFSVQVDRRSWERAARPIYTDLVERPEDRPAWATS